MKNYKLSDMEIEINLLSDGLGFGDNISYIKTPKRFMSQQHQSTLLKKTQKIQKIQDTKNRRTDSDYKRDTLKESDENLEVGNISIAVKTFSLVLDVLSIIALSLFSVWILKFFIADLVLINKNILFITVFTNLILLFSLLFKNNQSFGELMLNFKYSSQNNTFWFMRIFQSAYYV